MARHGALSGSTTSSAINTNAGAAQFLTGIMSAMRATPRTIALAVLVLLVLIAGYAAYTWFFNAKSARLAQLQWGDLAAWFGPSDARGGSFLLTLRNGGAVYANGALDYAEYLEGRLSVDYDRSGSAQALITYAKDAAMPYALTVDHAERVRSASPLQSVSLSPQGSAFAYARLVAPEAVLNDLGSWEAVLVEGEETRSLGAAFLVAFLGGDALALTRENGISIVGTDGAPRMSIARAFSLPTGVRMAASEDGKMLAVAEEGKADVYAIDVSAGSIQKIFATGVGAASSIEVTKDALYAVVQNEDGSSSLVRHAFDGTTKVVRSFGPAVSIAKIDL